MNKIVKWGIISFVVLIALLVLFVVIVSTIARNRDVSEVEDPPVGTETSMTAPREFTISNNVLTRYEGVADVVEVPAGVLAVGDTAFTGNSMVTEVILPEGLESIGFEAFRNCVNLRRIVLPATLNSIKESAFSGCINLVDWTINTSNYVVDGGALVDVRTSSVIFWASPDVEEVELSTLARSISSYALSRGSMSFVTLSTHIEEVGYRAFYGCENLRMVFAESATIDISPTAFEGCPKDIVLVGTEDSTLIALAKGYGYDYQILSSEDLGVLAEPISATVYFNGVASNFDSYRISGNHYFKLRDVAMTLRGTSKQFDILWDARTSALNLVSRKAYTVIGGELALGQTMVRKARLSLATVYMDGEEVSIRSYVIGGAVYFKLRDIARLFNIYVEFESENNLVHIDTERAYIEE